MEEEEEEGGREEAGGHTEPRLSFPSSLSPQRSLYSGLQSPGTTPGPALGSFAFLPTGSAGAPTPSDLSAPWGPGVGGPGY